MALRLRRGTNADRLTVTPAEGELLYTTDSKKIYAGDGSTVGGNIVSGINNLLEDLTPQLGGDLDLNSKSLVGNGNIDITGSITAPSFTGDFYGSVFGDDSELLVDVINSKILLSNNVLADLSDVQVTGLQPGNVLKWNGNNWYGATDNQVDLSAESLNSLGDVNVDGVQLGQVLAWGGSEWTSSELNLSQLADVNTNNAVQGYSLIFDGVNWQAGQVPVPDINNIKIDDLANVSAANPNNNNVLTYNLVTNNWENKSLTLDDITDIDLTGLQFGDILSWNGFNWVPDGGFGTIRETDIQGSVYGDDSNIIVNSNDNSITTTVLSATDVISERITTSDIVLESDTTFPAMIVKRTNDGAVFEGSAEKLAMIRFESESTLDTPNIRQSGVITSFVNKLIIGHTLDEFPAPTDFITLSSGNLRIGGRDIPTECLEVVGNAQIDGFVQFGSYTTIERDNLTTTNNPQYANNFGMVIYNVDVNKFQGWANVNGITPTWVDLS